MSSDSARRAWGLSVVGAAGFFWNVWAFAGVNFPDQMRWSLAFGVPLAILAGALLCFRWARPAAALLVGPLLSYGGAAAVYGVVLFARGFRGPDFWTGVLGLTPIILIETVPFFVGARIAWHWADRENRLRNTIISAVACAALFVVDFSQHNDQFGGRLNRAIADAGFGGRVDISTVTLEPWDTMHVFGWYTFPENIDAQLGFSILIARRRRKTFDRRSPTW